MTSDDRIRGDSIDFFGSVKRMITGQDVLIWLAVTAVVGMVCLILCRAGKMKKGTAVLVMLLGFYLAVIFTFTLAHRVPKQEYKYNLKLFWTIEAIRNGKKDLISESIWNVVLFIPLGVILALLMPEQGEKGSKSRQIWLPVLIGAGISFAVELIQLVGRLGLFEFDDILYNTAGCLIGVLMVRMIKILRKVYQE